MKFQFDIEAPPIWQDGEGSEQTAAGATGHPATATEQSNAAVMALFERLLTDVLKQRDQASADGKGFSAGEAFKAALDTQKDSAKQAIEFVREQSKDDGKGDSAVVTMLGNMLTEMMKSNNARKEDPILQLLLERALEKPADPFGPITALLTLLKELGIKIGPGRGVAEGGGSEWAGVVEKLVDKAPELMANAARLVPQRGPAPIAPGPVALPAASPVTPIRAGAAGAPQPQPITGTVPASPPANLPPESATPEVSPEVADRIAQNVVKAAIVRMLFAGDSGDDAAHYAEMAHEPLARTLASLLKTDPMQLKEDPILGQALTHVNVMIFAKEFVDYFEEEEQPPTASGRGEGTAISPAAA